MEVLRYSVAKVGLILFGAGTQVTVDNTRMDQVHTQYIHFS